MRERTKLTHSRMSERTNELASSVALTSERVASKQELTSTRGTSIGGALVKAALRRGAGSFWHAHAVGNTIAVDSGQSRHVDLE